MKNAADDFKNLLDYIKQNRGFDFTGYKPASLRRRIGKRMESLGIETHSDYQDYLEVHPEEFAQLFNTILINVTSFFRDAAAWDYVAAEIIPRLFDGKKPNESARIWSAGCASGEEPYTLAMLVSEILGEEQLRDRVKIYATDVDEMALDQGRRARYSANEIGAAPQALQDKYFERADERYVLRKDLRRSVIFGRHDLVKDAPISRIDLLVCRNTLIYFNAETQGKILARFRFAVDPEGLLFLGKAERLLTHTEMFTPVPDARHVFATSPRLRRKDRVQPEDGEVFLPRPPSARDIVRDAAFESSLVGQLVVDLEGVLVAANHEARALFGLHTGDLDRPLQDLDVAYYKPLLELRSQLERAYANRAPSILEEVEWPTSAGEPRMMDVEVAPVRREGGHAIGATVTFSDVTRYSSMRTELERSKRELEIAYEELQSSNEELETTNEELQSSNEELETTNEELQSSNEELETINEELQSTNEEMHTVNTQLREREGELRDSNALSDSILASLRGGMIVVDRDVRVQIWTSRAEDLWGLRSEEAAGQNFLNLDIGLPVARLKEPIRACLVGQEDFREVALNATTRRGTAVQCHVTCTPLKGPGAEILGTILFVEERGDADASRGGESRADMEKDLAPKPKPKPKRSSKK